MTQNTTCAKLETCLILGRDMICRLGGGNIGWRDHAVRFCGRPAAGAVYWLGIGRFRVIGTVAGVILLSCGGCRTSSEAPLLDQPTATTPVRLSPGDVIKLTFSGATELNQSQKIRTDGKVSLPIVGEVTAAGKTLVEFQNEVVRLYKPQLRNSEVLVTLESGVANVVVSGYVSKPGKFSFDRPTTIFQAIMEAGGATEYGNLRKVRLIRVTNGEQQTQVVNLSPTLGGKKTRAFFVKDGDVIYVPQSLF